MNSKASQQFLLFFILISSTISIFSQNWDGKYIHPRGLITDKELPKIRENVKHAPLNSIYNKLIETEKNIANKSIDEYKIGLKIKHQAILFLINNNKKKADECYQSIIQLSKDSAVSSDYSFGLTRTQALLEIATAYDFCYNGWSVSQRKEVSAIIYKLMKSITLSMGFVGNYALESNWMGIRYASVLYASSVTDDFEAIENPLKSKFRPFMFDSKERLMNHIEASYNNNGWFCESMSYQGYEWSFIGPALIAQQNFYASKGFKTEEYLPVIYKTIAPTITSTVSIITKDEKGVTADLSDDDPMFSLHLIPFGFRLYPENQLPYLKWAFDYLYDTSFYQKDDGRIFNAILYYPLHIQAQNPADYQLLNFTDSLSGVTIFRNKFKDENDVVATFFAKNWVKRGHQGYDNLTFRIIGNGSIWAVGAGRTGMVAGQTNLFPNENPDSIKGQKITSELTNYKKNIDGSGYGEGKGSCLGTTNHQRYFEASYHPDINADAAFIIADKSTNGYRWRMNTPEFNKTTILPDGFLLTAPNGATMKATVINVSNPLIETSQIRYGGDTERLNHGICYNDICYEYSTAIDVIGQSNIIVVLTLVKKDETHPAVIFNKDKRTINIGHKEFMVSDGYLK